MSPALGALLLTFTAGQASATGGDGDAQCPSGTNPVSVGSGVICVVVTDPGSPGNPGDPGHDSSEQTPAKCHKFNGAEVPCQTNDGYWWSAYQCYAAPYDAPPGSTEWQGHSDGSLWICTICFVGGAPNTCRAQIIWVAPGEEPGPPTPEQLATMALGQLPLKKADIHTAPSAPSPTYVGVENWLWIPTAQWITLSKSVTAGSTTVTVSASPEQVLWDLGPKKQTCRDPGKAWVTGMTDAATTTCSYSYKVASADESDGVFPISATIKYHVTWTCTGTCPTASGDLGIVNAPVGTSMLQVLQRQTVVVQ